MKRQRGALERQREGAAAGGPEVGSQDLTAPVWSCRGEEQGDHTRASAVTPGKLIADFAWGVKGSVSAAGV